MEEKTIKMILFYVLAIYDDNKKTFETCIEVTKLLIAMIKNEETKADKLLNKFPQEHPVSKLYSEIKNQDNLLELLEYSKEKFENTKTNTNAIRNIQDDGDIEKLSIELLKKGYIPFAITEFGDLICINNKNIELYLHEMDSFEFVNEDIEMFFEVIY